MSEANCSLEELVGKLFDAKRREEAAKDERIEVETAIASQIETAVNGSKTVSAGNGMKITVKRAMSYKVDVERIRALKIPEDDLPIKYVPAIPAGWEFDAKLYEDILEDSPDVARELAQFVTATPRKPSVTVKLA